MLVALLLAIGLCYSCPKSDNCTDNDRDGFGLDCPAGADCNDNDPEVFPGAPELCDGKDNQCPGDPGSGKIDEGCRAPEPCACGQALTSDCTLNSDLVCPGNGLIVAADDITIDGNGFTLTGDGGSTVEPDSGIMIANRSRVTVKNFAAISNFFCGIAIQNSSGCAILNNTLGSNKQYAIAMLDSNQNQVIANSLLYNYRGALALSRSDNNEIRQNAINFNIPMFGMLLSNSSYNNIMSNNLDSNKYNILLNEQSNYNNIIDNSADYAVEGIHINNSDSNVLEGNSAGSNWRGIVIDDSYNNYLRYNLLNKNIANLAVNPGLRDGVADPETMNNFIDATNLVENKPVYYLYNEFNKVYDGNLIGEIGMFWCAYCENVTVQNAVLSPNNQAGVAFYLTRNSTIKNVRSGKSFYGIYLQSSDNNIIENSVLESDYGAGIRIESSTANSINQNQISECGQDLGFDESSLENTFLKNNLAYNDNNMMVKLEDMNRIYMADENINFKIRTYDIRGGSCPDCTVAARTSPAESLNFNPADLIGNFTPRRPGYYSLVVMVQDKNGNSAKTNFPFFISADRGQTARYFLRGISPTHGQPAGSDAKSLLFDPPGQTETWWCDHWILNTVDRIPDFPFAILSGVSINSWYRVTGQARFGIQKDVSYWSKMDFGRPVPESRDYSFGEVTIAGLNWPIAFPKHWYRIALKMSGAYLGSYPFWQTRPERPSYADFSYIYPQTPAVKTISDYEALHLLSATESGAGKKDATLEIDGNGAGNILLDNFSSPFLNYPVLIKADSTALIEIADLQGETVLRALDMNITPSSGELTVNIINWENSGNFYKKWTEKSSGPGNIKVVHKTGELEPNASYRVLVDGQELGGFVSNSSREIIFNYEGELSGSKTFEIIKR